MAVMEAEEARENIISAIVVFAFVGLVVWMFDLGVTIYQYAGLFAVLLVLGWLSRNTADLTVGFIILSTAVLYLFVDLFVPAFITDPFGVLVMRFEELAGFSPAEVPAWALFIVVLVFVPLMIAVRIRATGKAKKIPTIFDRTSRRLARYVDAYATIGRLMALFVFAVAVILLEQGAELAGQMGNVVAEAPFITSNFVTGIVGYASLGGSLPIVGDIPYLGAMPAGVFAVIVILAMALAAAVRWEGSGPLNQFLNRR